MIRKPVDMRGTGRHMKMSRKLVIIGASGHGKVLLDIALKDGYEVVGFLDDNEKAQPVLGYPVLGRTADLVKYQADCSFVIAIGANHIRERIASQYEVTWATLIHPAAVIGMDVEIGEGTVVMANAVINPSARIGKHCIINTGAVVEHDNQLEDYVHLSPKAVLAGTVAVGRRSQIGAGACVRNNLTITADVLVGAGAAVVKDIDEAGIYTGVPARKKKEE